MTRRKYGSKKKDSKERYESPQVEKVKISSTYKLSMTAPDEETESSSCAGPTEP